MATNQQLTVSKGTVEPGWCPNPSNTWDSLLAKFIEKMEVTLPSTYSTLIISSSEPAPEDRDKLWWKLAADLSPDKPYIYFDGAWVSRHLSAASGDERRLWVGTTGALDTYDGGEVGTVSNKTGPMWEVDTAFDAKFLAGPGTFDNAGTLGVASDMGADQVTLVKANLPSSPLNLTVNRTGGDDGSTGKFTSGSGNAQTPETDPTSTVQTEDMGSDDPFDIIPPVRGIYVIKRTARIFYRAV